jgi:hypothetical protein
MYLMTKNKSKTFFSKRTASFIFGLDRTESLVSGEDSLNNSL